MPEAESTAMSADNSLESDDFLKEFADTYEAKKEETMSLAAYLKSCREDKSYYMGAAERILKAFGTPESIDTSGNDRLRRIFENRTIERFPAFKDFYGMEESIMKIANFLRSSAQGLEESKQIMYLLGPVGSAKSSLAEKIKKLVEEEPIYVLKSKKSGELSPHFESPLAIFDEDKHSAKLGIPQRYLKPVMSPWANKRLHEAGGDPAKAFEVVKIFPSRLDRIAVAKTEPGDDNNQDVTTLIGKPDIRKLEEMSQNDPDAYLYSGSLNRTTQGVHEFVEMFKAPLKMLNPLLTATQEGNYNGTENIGAMPFYGLNMAHSNESEWESFKNDKKNEAFLDRVRTIKVPYCLRVDEEVQIYDKLLRESELSQAPCAPHTLEMLAQWSVLTRLEDPMPEGRSDVKDYFTKMDVYNGEDLKGKSTKAKTITTYRENAGVNEGMSGSSTRFAFKVLSDTFNFESASGGEVAADPVHLMYVLENQIKAEQFPEEKEQMYMAFLKELQTKYAEYVKKQIQQAYLESYSDYGQNIFDRYIQYADAWISDNDFKNPDTGTMMTRAELEKELEKIEKRASIANPKDFRNEVVMQSLRYERENPGEKLPWTSYGKMRDVIEARIFTNFEEIAPVISFSAKKSADEKQKHHDFVERMKANGYTERQTQRIVDWATRAHKFN